MKSFSELKEIALSRKGAEELEEGMPAVPEKPLSDQTDDRLLSAFSRGIFATGLSWTMIDNKWPAFEEAFHGFDIGRNALMSDEDLDAHLQNKGIVRHAAKILSVRDNAVFLSGLAKEHGSAVKYLGSWPEEDQVSLSALLKKEGSRLGGMTGAYALRTLGYDNFILSKSVVAALNMAGVIDGAATSKKAQAAIQEAFNTWVAESGESYARVSRVLAMAVPD